MKKFLVALLMLISATCSAATIEPAHFNGNEGLIYPVVHVDDAAVERKINTAIIAEVDRFVTGVYRNAQVNNLEVGGVYTSFDIGSNEAGNTVILSVIVTESCFYKMAAHPSTYRRALNFNTSSGELMDVSYLTDVGEGIPVSDLCDRLTQKLKAKAERENLFLFDDALPLKELPSDFYWDENLHVHFIFQQYEVAPYAVGIIDVDFDA